MARFCLPRRLTTLCALSALLLGAAGHAQAPRTLAEFSQPALKDLNASVKISNKNNAELKKIGKGYVDGYSLSNQEVWWQQPDRVRFQGKKGLLTVRRITNGDRQLLEVPPLHRKVTDLTKKPGKGDSIADIGIITSDWARDVESRWLRQENRNGKVVQVFEYWEKLDPKYKHTIVVDPETRTMLERVDHHRNPRTPSFRKKLIYLDVQEVGGVKLPSRVEIYNGENRLGAVMRYEKVKVNTNLSDKMFKI